SRTGRRRDSRGRDAADRRRSADRRPARTLRRISGCGAHRDGNFTVRRSPRESGVGTLESDTEPRLAAHRPGATATCGSQRLMTDSRSTDPESTQRHEVPSEPARPPVIRTSGEPERYSPPPAEARPEWTRHDPAPSAAATPER